MAEDFEENVTPTRVAFVTFRRKERLLASLLFIFQALHIILHF